MMAGHDTNHDDTDRTDNTAGRALNEALMGSFRLLTLAMLVVVLAFLASGVFVVKAHERAFVLRFGEIVSDADGRAVLEPGLYVRWPFLIDEIVRFPVQRMLDQRIDTFWYREQDRGSSAVALSPGGGLMSLSGDANVLHSNWRVKYRVEDPVKFCRRVADPAAFAAEKPVGAVERLMEFHVSNAVLHAMAGFPVDEAYRHRKGELRRRVQERLEQQLALLDVGIRVYDVILDAVVPPRRTKAAFDDVLSAEMENKELREKADSYREEAINQAKGEASRSVAEAMAYKTRVVQQADADAQYVSDLVEKYPADPTKLRLFLERRLEEVREEVMRAADERFVIKSAGTNGGNSEVRIMINRDPDARRKKNNDVSP